MVTIYNRLSQPLSIGEDIIAADGSIELEHSSKELQKLVDRGHISIVREKADSTTEVSGAATQDTNTAPATPAISVPTTEQAVTKGSFKGDKK